MPWFGWNHVLYYRKDWYDRAKLMPIGSGPDWLANVKALHKPPERFGLLMYNANDAEVKYIVSLIAQWRHHVRQGPQGGRQLA